MDPQWQEFSSTFFSAGCAVVAHSCPSSSIMSRDIPTFEAKCASCRQTFEHPGLGSAYGETVFCSTDGKHYAWASAFSALAQKIRALPQGHAANAFWQAVAHLADPILGQELVAAICCSHCASTNLEFWEGVRVGVMSVPEASFLGASALSAEELQCCISKLSSRPASH